MRFTKFFTEILNCKNISNCLQSFVFLPIDTGNVQQEIIYNYIFANTSIPFEWFHTIVGIGFPFAEQFRITDFPYMPSWSLGCTSKCGGTEHKKNIIFKNTYNIKAPLKMYVFI